MTEREAERESEPKHCHPHHEASLSISVIMNVWISADVYVSASQSPYHVIHSLPLTQLVLFCDNRMDSLVSHTALS